MYKNGVKRRLARVFDTAEHHSDYPEEYDVVTCNKRACGIEILQVLRLFGPAKG